MHDSLRLRALSRKESSLVGQLGDLYRPTGPAWIVMPAQAGIDPGVPRAETSMDSRLRGNDEMRSGESRQV